MGTGGQDGVTGLPGEVAVRVGRQGRGAQRVTVGDRGDGLGPREGGGRGLVHGHGDGGGQRHAGVVEVRRVGGGVDDCLLMGTRGQGRVSGLPREGAVLVIARQGRGAQGFAVGDGGGGGPDDGGGRCLGDGHGGGGGQRHAGVVVVRRVGGGVDDGLSVGTGGQDGVTGLPGEGAVRVGGQGGLAQCVAVGDGAGRGPLNGRGRGRDDGHSAGRHGGYRVVGGIRALQLPAGDGDGLVRAHGGVRHGGAEVRQVKGHVIAGDGAFQRPAGAGHGHIGGAGVGEGRGGFRNDRDVLPVHQHLAGLVGLQGVVASVSAGQGGADGGLMGRGLGVLAVQRQGHIGQGHGFAIDDAAQGQRGGVLQIKGGGAAVGKGDVTRLRHGQERGGDRHSRFIDALVVIFARQGHGVGAGLLDLGHRLIVTGDQDGVVRVLGQRPAIHGDGELLGAAVVLGAEGRHHAVFADVPGVHGDIGNRTSCIVALAFQKKGVLTGIPYF